MAPNPMAAVVAKAMPSCVSRLRDKPPRMEMRRIRHSAPTTKVTAAISSGTATITEKKMDDGWEPGKACRSI